MSIHDFKMLQLRQLTVEDQAAFDTAIVAFAGSSFRFAFGYQPGDDFVQYLRELDDLAAGRRLRPGQVPSLFLVGDVAGTIVGRLSLRLSLNHDLATVGGHIGFGVCPAHRGNRYASAMLAAALPIAKAHGLDEVLLTCDASNHASKRTIVGCGGRFDGAVVEPVSGALKERYWITTLGTGTSSLIK